MKSGLKFIAVALIATSSVTTLTPANAQVARWVLRGGVWVLEGVVQDQVNQHIVYPAAIQVGRWATSDPMNANGGTYANSTPMQTQYQQPIQQTYNYQQPQQQYQQPQQHYYYQQPQQVYQQQQQRYYYQQPQPQPQYYLPAASVQRKVCSNGRQQWYC